MLWNNPFVHYKYVIALIDECQGNRGPTVSVLGAILVRAQSSQVFG